MELKRWQQAHRERERKAEENEAMEARLREYAANAEEEEEEFGADPSDGKAPISSAVTVTGQTDVASESTLEDDAVGGIEPAPEDVSMDSIVASVRGEGDDVHKAAGLEDVIQGSNPFPGSEGGGFRDEACEAKNGGTLLEGATESSRVAIQGIAPEGGVSENDESSQRSALSISGVPQDAPQAAEDTAGAAVSDQVEATPAGDVADAATNPSSSDALATTILPAARPEIVRTHGREKSSGQSLDQASKVSSKASEQTGGSDSTTERSSDKCFSLAGGEPVVSPESQALWEEEPGPEALSRGVELESLGEDCSCSVSLNLFDKGDESDEATQQSHSSSKGSASVTPFQDVGVDGDAAKHAVPSVILDQSTEIVIARALEEDGSGDDCQGGGRATTTSTSGSGVTTKANAATTSWKIKLAADGRLVAAPTQPSLPFLFKAAAEASSCSPHRSKNIATVEPPRSKIGKDMTGIAAYFGAASNSSTSAGTGAAPTQYDDSNLESEGVLGSTATAVEASLTSTGYNGDKATSYLNSDAAVLVGKTSNDAAKDESGEKGSKDAQDKNVAEKEEEDGKVRERKGKRNDEEKAKEPKDRSAKFRAMLEAADDPPVLDWGRWGVVPSRDEDCGAEEMVLSSTVTYQPSYLPVVGSGGLVHGVDVEQDEPPVFEWDRWGVIPSRNEDCGAEEMVPSSTVNHQPCYLPVVFSGGRVHGVDVEQDEPPVFEWDRWGVIPSRNEDCGAQEMVPSSTVTHQPCYLPVIGSGGLRYGVDVVETEEDTELFDMESFANRMVEDSPPAKAAYMLAPARVSSPVVRAPDPEFATMPIVNITDGGIRSGIAGFEPSAIDNIPPLVDSLPLERQVPWALARSDYGGFPLPSSGAKPVSPAVQSDGTTHFEVRNNVFDNPVSTGDAVAPTRLIGADDDDRHTLMREQEIVHQIGPGFLSGFGQPRVVDPSQRTALVDKIATLHAAAPAASGGGPPLYFGTLFLAVNILDRFLSTDKGCLMAFEGRRGLKVAGAACLGIASKYEDIQSVATSLWGLAVAGTWGATETVGANDDELHAARKDLAAMELEVLSALSYRLTVPTALSFLGEFFWRASLLGYLPEGPTAATVHTEAQEILLRVLRHMTWLDHMPSALAAAAFYWASCMSSPGAAPPSSSAISAVTGYELEILRHCFRDMETVRIGGGGTGRSDGCLGFGRAGVALPEHAGRILLGAGGGHPSS